MLPPLTVPQVIGYQDIAASAGPKDAHVLQFTTRFGRVMSMTDQDSGRLVAWRIGNIEIRGDDEAWAARVRDVVDDITLATVLPRGAQV